MIELIKIVIPKILTEWEHIAYALYYEISTVDGIKQKGREDPRKCCEEFFKDWLQTNNGARTGPKVWSTLLDTLKKVDTISADTIKDIVAKVKQLKYD